MQKYRLPLQLDNDDCQCGGCCIKASELIPLINKYDIDIDCPSPNICWVIGTKNVLADFFSELDGPAQSFPIDEFVEYIQDYKLV